MNMIVGPSCCEEINLYGHVLAIIQAGPVHILRIKKAYGNAKFPCIVIFGIWEELREVIKRRRVLSPRNEDPD